jgi:hypothetical protein
MTTDNFDLSAWTQEQRDRWLGGARKAGESDHVPLSAEAKHNYQIRIGANRAASVAGPFLPRKVSAWQRQRIADEKSRAPEPRTKFDPARYDPAKPYYEYDPATYDPADYEEWKLARIAYELKRWPHRSNPFGPDSAAAVRIKQSSKGVITAAYNGIVQFFRTPRQ